ncbi:MAG: hypothetical protein PHO27_11540 [Sulfuricurvum sp.]|nr:hypothetical protein [Sulfuricurvum sp.]
MSEQERIGLEEVFLSISSSQSIMQKWSVWSKNLSFLFEPKKFSFPLPLGQNQNIWIKDRLKTHKITKLFNKIQKRRKI